ncbi:hypothetical protein BLNAU_15341 [Blattamonas nauphoetae]|uniref:Uncharacterized protein n=1 Tax=Blattamonas nauphoetae TaxID=2049346 RepID=A0ABQ9XGJ9_9EUKA|nr:hypothetical protein BLNAU_15341 [Blattamonas nauphoetae]
MRRRTMRIASFPASKTPFKQSNFHFNIVDAVPASIQRADARCRRLPSDRPRHCSFRHRTLILRGETWQHGVDYNQSGKQLATIHADVARFLHLLRDNNFQYVAPCLITWESVFRYALRLDVTDITNPVDKLNLRFGDICPLFKTAYEQDTTPIDDSPPPPLAPRFEDMESEDGHFDTSKIEQSVKTAMGNADVGAYTSLSSHAPSIQGGIFYTPNIGHLIKPEKMIVLTEGQCFGKIDILHQSDQGEEPGEGCDLWRTSREATALDDAYSCEFRDRNRIVCSNLFHTSKQTRGSMQLHANATTPRYHDTLLLTSSVHCRRLSEGFKRYRTRIRKMCIRPSSDDLEMPRRPLLSKKTPPIWPLHTLSCNRRLSTIWSFFEVEDETRSVILL